MKIDKEFQLDSVFSQIAEQYKDGIFVCDSELKCIYWNPAMEKMSGTGAHEILDKHILDVFPFPKEESIYQLIEKTLTGENTTSRDFEYHIPETGQRAWAQIINVPLRNKKSEIAGVICTVRDISERKNAELKLQESHNFVDQVLSNVATGVFVLDRNLKYSFWNPGMERISGKSSDEVLGKHSLELFPFLKDAGIYQLYGKVLAGENAASGVYEFRVPETGRSGWGTDYYVPLKDEKGEISGLIGTVIDITKRKETEKLLRQREELFSNLLTQVPGVIFQLQQFEEGPVQYHYISSEVREIFELTPEEVLRDSSVIFERIYPEDRDTVISNIRKSYHTLENWEHEYRVMLPGKGLKWLRGRAKPEIMTDHSVTWHGYITDITEEKRTTEANAKLKKQFQAVLDTIPNFIFVKDIEGKVLMANKAATDFYKTSIENLIGKTDVDLGVDEAKAIEYNKSNKKIIETGDPSFMHEEPYIDASGKTVWHQAIKVPFQHPEMHNLCVLIVVTDITELKNKESELNDTLSLINEQNKRLQNFAHIVTHNLRNHAGSISMLLSLYNDEESSDEKEQLLKYLETASERLSETIQDLNEIVDVQNSKTSDIKPLNLGQYLSNIKEILTTEIISNNVIINEDVPDDFTINYIPAYLESILLNLLSNAIKYRHTKRQLVIKVKAFKREGKHIFVISDNGMGIDLDKHGQKLFGLYETFHENKNSKGVGLFITKSHIESMGGSIEVESKKGKGTTFKIKFD